MDTATICIGLPENDVQGVWATRADTNRQMARCTIERVVSPNASIPTSPNDPQNECGAIVGRVDTDHTQDDGQREHLDGGGTYGLLTAAATTCDRCHRWF